MAIVTVGKKACAVNPLKMSQPIGGAFAYLGLRGAMPLLHGSQGCTSFGLTLFVRHFKDPIPLQTTAMSEVATVLGGYENVEQAILNIHSRTKPEIIGICSTGVTETKGDDVDGYIKLIREKYPQLAKFPLVYVSTPDFKDAFQDGWEKTVARIVEVLVEPPVICIPNVVWWYAGAAGACSTRTFDQSRSSSSATSIGSVVQIPWPISECARSTVTLSSAPIRRNALGSGSGFAGGAAGTATFIAVMSAVAATRLGEGADAVTAEAGGIHVAFVLGAVIATLAFLATFLVRRSEPGQDEEDAEGTEEGNLPAAH